MTKSKLLSGFSWYSKGYITDMRQGKSRVSQYFSYLILSSFSGITIQTERYWSPRTTSQITSYLLFFTAVSNNCNSSFSWFQRKRSCRRTRWVRCRHSYRCWRSGIKGLQNWAVYSCNRIRNQRVQAGDLLNRCYRNRPWLRSACLRKNSYRFNCWLYSIGNWPWR